MDKYDFGYPQECSLCASASNCKHELRVEPYLKVNGKLRLMLIGQDPTIRKDSNRVKEVFMLDDNNSQLAKWLKKVIGTDAYDKITIYATNVVKCTFETVPTDSDQGGKRFLAQYYENCKSYLIDEVHRYQPTVVMTLGEPAHQFFISILDDCGIANSMNKAFTGGFITASINGSKFYYSPCLHIQTFRVAETYGGKVNQFKASLSALLVNDSFSQV